jgi:hypothetical protein
MRTRMAALLAVACCFSAGCIIGFKYPLGPVKKAMIDPRLLGAWKCRDTDQKPGQLTFMDYDGRQYLLYFTAEGEEPTHMRAYSTQLKGRVFLNFQALEPKPHESTWQFLEYSFPEQGRLSVRSVKTEPFEKVRESAKDVRRLLERNLDNADFFDPLWSCAKAEPKKDGQ